jgi:hypothetical protein
MSYIASRLAAVKPFASMASMAAKALRARGVDIDLCVGELDFPTPVHTAPSTPISVARA